MASQEAVSIFGVRISNNSQQEAVNLVEELIKNGTTHSIFIVNAHTLNVASEDPQYRVVLNGATKVWADGTGARWAARMRGMKLKANLVGTDLIPRLFETTAGRGYRYFLLGSTPDTVSRAAKTCLNAYPGWNLAGFHHGYVDEDKTGDLVEQINGARPDLLLVAMGNPRQEIWIQARQAELKVPVCIGVGGLFDHWAGNLRRAPLWVRTRGFEWLQILLQQPHKWRRYLLGNPRFLLRMVVELRQDRRLMSQSENAVCSMDQALAGTPSKVGEP